MIDLIKKNGNQNITSEVRRLLVFVNLIATNGRVLLSGGDLKNYCLMIAQKLISSSIAEFGTYAPLAAIHC
jgi:hypothetical protein